MSSMHDLDHVLVHCVSLRIGFANIVMMVHWALDTSLVVVMHYAMFMASHALHLDSPVDFHFCVVPLLCRK